MRRDAPFTGLLVGLLFPVLGFGIMFLLWRHNLSFSSFMNILSKNPKEFAKVLTMSLLANLIPFVYCNTKRIDLTMRGIVVATMLYAVLIVLIMFVW